ncbi:MAG: hypothetical protein ACP5IJ_02780 [Candidatus Nanoarchaeia archaeon]
MSNPTSSSNQEKEETKKCPNLEVIVSGLLPIPGFLPIFPGSLIPNCPNVSARCKVGGEPDENCYNNYQKCQHYLKSLESKICPYLATSKTPHPSGSYSTPSLLGDNYFCKIDGKINTEFCLENYSKCPNYKKNQANLENLKKELKI